jgi:hypothetical protein
VHALAQIWRSDVHSFPPSGDGVGTQEQTSSSTAEGPPHPAHTTPAGALLHDDAQVAITFTQLLEAGPNTSQVSDSSVE